MTRESIAAGLARPAPPPEPHDLHVIALDPGVRVTEAAVLAVALLEAVARLRARGRLPSGFRITLRATGFDDRYRPVIHRLGVEDLVELAPSLGYREALREIMDADGLLLFQGHTSNPAIPAKAYEYLRAARPILAMVSDDGETAALLRRLKVGTFAPIERIEEIEHALEEFLCGIASDRNRVLPADASASLERRHRVKEFAALMDRLTVVPARSVIG